jgi:formylmethanofuran dehydrogenase subunit D
MIFVKNAEVYATVWDAELSENGKYMDIRMSTSEKVDDEYQNSNWFCRVIGHALNSIKGVREGDRIKITSFKQTNLYNKETKKSYFRTIILDAEFANKDEKPKEELPREKKTKSAKNKINNLEEQKECDTEECPW